MFYSDSVCNFAILSLPNLPWVQVSSFFTTYCITKGQDRRDIKFFDNTPKFIFTADAAYLLLVWF